MHWPHRRRLFAGTEPGLGDYALPNPPLERNVGQTRANEAAVEVEALVEGQPLDDFLALGVGGQPLAEFRDRGVVTRPGDVLRWIERRITLHQRAAGSIF